MSDASTGRTAYRKLQQEMREASLLSSAASVLGWDQETMMPPKGAQLRAEQLAALGALVHERVTRPEVGDWLAASEADAELRADPLASANLRELRREYDRAVRIPSALVREMAQTAALSQQAWRDARERSDFALFAPWLDKVFSLSRAKAECLAESGAPLYDALMEEYEPGAGAARLETVFSELRARLAPLIAAIAERGPPQDARAQAGDIPVEAQRALNTRVLERMGFDFAAGRLDPSTHPFCQGVGPGDTRLTTRFREDDFLDALSSTMHEAGHGLYEQGLPKTEFPGLPLSEAASLGIHESQSRLWENLVGRSLPFVEWLLPEARTLFGGAVQGVTPERLYRASNVVRPNLIRVDSDEATYNLHVMLRFDLERAMLDGDLPVAELPGAWNERIRRDLGIDVPDDRRGCLQDIHWSMGAVGYFPTYTLGNLYAAQLWEAIGREIGDLQDQLRRGEFGALLAWLRRHVHQHGRRFTAAQLCERATGAPLSAEPFVRYLESKYRPLYDL